MSRLTTSRYAFLSVVAVLMLGAIFLPRAAGAVPIAFVWDVQCGVTEPVCLLVVPDGSGMTFQEARTIDGTVVDATISVLIWLVDEFGPIGPLPSFDAEYLTIQAPDGLTHGCLQEHVAAADHDTDQEGWTEFSVAPRAGGWSHDLLEIYVVDDPASQVGSDIPPMPIYFNSPDINGDRHVDLTDVSLFAQDYYAGTNPFRSDLAWDGVVNLADVSVFAQHFGASCQ